MNKQSIINFDFLRVTACFLVVLLHTAAFNFSTFDEYWWASNFYDSLARCSVPVFFMISGALLLRKQENIFLFYKKRFIRLLPTIIVWSIIYMLWNNYNGLSYGNAWGWAQSILQGPVCFHLWYLYCIFGLYLLIPFLQKIYVKTNTKEKILFLLICLLSSAIPSLSYLFDLKIDIVAVYNLQYFSGFIGYLFAGAILYEYNNKIMKHKFINIAGYIVSIICIMFFTYFFSKKHGTPLEIFYDYLSVFVIIASLFYFNIVFEMGSRLSPFFVRFFRYFSQLTLGIYCIHVLILDRIRAIFSINAHIGNDWLAIPCTAVLVFSLSAVVISIIKKVKILRIIT